MRNNQDLITRTVLINAQPSVVWQFLTTPDLMEKWMADANMEIKVITCWTVGNPIIIKGTIHGREFENKGTILKYEQESVLAYSHLSSISLLPASIENFCTIEFSIVSVKNGTTLTLIIKNFPTDSIYHHMNFYWSNTINILKEKIEEEI